MEEQPSRENSTEAEAAPHRQASDRLQGIGRIILVSLVGSALYGLAVGPRNLRGFSNGLFFAGALLLTVGLMPLFSGFSNRAAVIRRLDDSSSEDGREEEQEQVQPAETTAYLFGVSGFIIIVMSLIIGFAVR